MNVITWSRETIRRMTILDFAIIKIYLVALGMILGAVLHATVKGYIWWFIGTVCATLIWILVRFFWPYRKKAEKKPAQPPTV
jgi:membrane protein implicated in regulation of membrane protease activity